MSFTHKLQTARESAGLSRYELAKLAGISHTVIYNIETGRKALNHIGTHFDVAQAIATELYVQVEDIFDSAELTHRGRNPHTGRALGEHHEQVVRLCPTCNTQVPATGICDDHGDITRLVHQAG